MEVYTLESGEYPSDHLLLGIFSSVDAAVSAIKSVYDKHNTERKWKPLIQENEEDFVLEATYQTKYGTETDTFYIEKHKVDEI